MQSGNPLNVLDTLKAELAMLNNENMSLKAQNFEIKQSLFELMSSRADLSQQVTLLKETLARVLNDHSHFHNTLSSFEREIKALRTENANLKSRYSMLELRMKKAQTSNDQETYSSSSTPRKAKISEFQSSMAAEALETNSENLVDDSSNTSKPTGKTLDRLESLKKKLETAFTDPKRKDSKNRISPLNEKSVSPNKSDSLSGSTKQSQLISKIPQKEVTSSQGGLIVQGITNPSLMGQALGAKSYQQSNPYLTSNPYETSLKFSHTQEFQSLSRVPDPSYLPSKDVSRSDPMRILKDDNITQRKDDLQFQNTINYSMGNSGINANRNFSFNQMTNESSVASPNINKSHSTAFTPSFTDGVMNASLQSESARSRQLQEPITNYHPPLGAAISNIDPKMYTGSQNHLGITQSTPNQDHHTNYIKYDVELYQTNIGSNSWTNPKSTISNEFQSYRPREELGGTAIGNKEATYRFDATKASSPKVGSTQEDKNNLHERGIGERGMQEQNYRQPVVEFKDTSYKEVTTPQWESNRLGLGGPDIYVQKNYTSYPWGGSQDTTGSTTHYGNLTGDRELFKRSMASDIPSSQNVSLTENPGTRSTKRLILTKKGEKSKGSMDIKD